MKWLMDKRVQLITIIFFIALLLKVFNLVELPTRMACAEEHISTTQMVANQATEAVRDLAILQAKDMEKQECLVRI